MPRPQHHAFWLTQSGNIMPTWPGGSFGSLDNWEIINRQTYLNGRDMIGGFPAPWPIPIPGTTEYPSKIITATPIGWSFDPSKDLGLGRLVLWNSGNCYVPIGTGLCVVRGPILISKNYVTLSANSTFQFTFRSETSRLTGYCTYAYLLNSDGSTQTLVDVYGGSNVPSGWITIKHTVTVTSEYKFVFINGSWNAQPSVFADGTQYFGGYTQLGGIAIY